MSKELKTVPADAKGLIAVFCGFRLSKCTLVESDTVKGCKLYYELLHECELETIVSATNYNTAISKQVVAQLALGVGQTKQEGVFEATPNTNEEAGVSSKIGQRHDTIIEVCKATLGNWRGVLSMCPRFSHTGDTHYHRGITFNKAEYIAHDKYRTKTRRAVKILPLDVKVTLRDIIEHAAGDIGIHPFELYNQYNMKFYSYSSAHDTVTKINFASDECTYSVEFSDGFVTVTKNIVGTRRVDVSSISSMRVKDAFKKPKPVLTMDVNEWAHTVYNPSNIEFGDVAPIPPVKEESAEGDKSLSRDDAGALLVTAYPTWGAAYQCATTGMRPHPSVMNVHVKFVTYGGHDFTKDEFERYKWLRVMREGNVDYQTDIAIFKQASEAWNGRTECVRAWADTCDVINEILKYHVVKTDGAGNVSLVPLIQDGK